MEQHQVDFGHSVTREVLHNGQVYYYTIGNLERESIDAWVEASTETLTWHPKTTTLRSVHHVTTLSGIISPYANKAIRTVTEASQDFAGYTAVVVEQSLTAQVIKVVMRQLSRLTRQFSIRFFTLREEAIQWLLEQPDITL